MSDVIGQAVAIVEDIAVGNLTAAEELLLADLMNAPQTTVKLHIEVKFRAFKTDFGNVTVVDHSWQWPIPPVYAKANPAPISINHSGIQFAITLAPPSQGTGKDTNAGTGVSGLGTGKADAGANAGTGDSGPGTGKADAGAGIQDDFGAPDPLH